MRKKVKCFDEVFDKTKPYIIMDAGIRVIEVGQITGTINKCGELDHRFRPLRRNDRLESFRHYQLHRAASEHTSFPPISVYLFKGEYFVIDGNRRVAAAFALGIEFIDAYVHEYIHKHDAQALSGALSRRRFEAMTGLKSIGLGYECGYEDLLRDISSYSTEDDIAARARKWYSERYLPACSHIRRSQLPYRYPKLRTGDIFVLITRFYHDHFDSTPKGVDFRSLISAFMFAHRIPEKRLLRFLPFRLLHTLLTRKIKKDMFLYDRMNAKNKS